MNKVRSSMSVFFIAVLAIAVLGWRWSAVLPAAKQEGARVVLGLVFLATWAAMAVVWTANVERTA